MEKKSSEIEKCCARLEVPTDEELAALNALRKIKERVRELKKSIKALSSGKGEQEKEKVKVLESELFELRAQWDEWEKKRKEAARRRMMMLGHEKPR
ncbi:MAG: hypothetical protein JRI79_10525 [Deltaproteobacteria bacterium]|nr:hypothetical protein [Deltaproteobacteria bacterium]MBW1919951.1 hypothetical protein [Deltaproteobacteria bacterium]MBW1935198.1 hypothetical protein [Deltaproteobacteria bacterium]MBW1978382.1 hypothetical protein [Deltaproteobacteria bacterium]MBW2301697.1 hypothetical protein [Deltaproteobacteria bacterium]